MPDHDRSPLAPVPVNGAQPFGVLLMTYGSPSSLEDVPRYMRAVRGGREPDPDLVVEFTRRYRVIGGSPLVQITAAQADALDAALGGDAVVRTGMRFSPPSIRDGLQSLAQAGVDEVVGIILSPQYSPMIMGGYGRAVEAARRDLSGDRGETGTGAEAGERAETGVSGATGVPGATGEAGVADRAPTIRIAGAWHEEPSFIDALAGRIREALGRFPASEAERVPVLLTAHSLPRRVADAEPGYLAQLGWTAQAVAERAGLAPDRWTFCWQSAGHEPGEWMKPDFADLMPELRAAGHRSVLVAPVQFLADHLEILYDIDVGAREQAEAQGLAFARIESLNTDPRFIAALASVARREVRAMAAEAPREGAPVAG